MQMQCVDAQRRVNEYFESSSDYWNEIYSGDKLLPTIYQDRHNTALDWIRKLGLRADARVLEIGCGAGLITVALAGEGHTVDAMDTTTAMLQMTRRHAVHRGVQDRIRLHLADVHALPFEAQTFDLVIAIGVIPWLHSEQAALQEIHRVLKRGGHLLVTADNNARLNRILDPVSSPVLAPLRAVAKRLLKLCGSWSPDPGFQPKRHYPHEVDRLIDGCNLKKLRSATVGFGPFTVFGKELFPGPLGIRLHRQLQSLAARRARIPLGWAGSHYLMLAAKD